MTGMRRLTYYALIFCAWPAVAQQTSPAAGAENSCELHVWPSAGLNSAYHGWFHGGINNGAVNGREGYPSVPAKPIDSAAQRAVLGGMDLATLFDLKGYKVIVHDEALESRTIRSTPGRFTPSASPCYTELVIDTIVFQQDVIEGRFLKMLARFRDFGTGGDTPRRTFGTWVQSRLSKFPPAADADVSEAIADLNMAFKDDVGTFAGFLQKASAGPKKK